MLLASLLGLATASDVGSPPGTALTTGAGTSTVPANVLFFDMDAAVIAESLDYEEQLVAFVFEGLVNEMSLSAPTVMFKAGYMNYDWPESDDYWNGWLTEQKRATFTNVSSATLCAPLALSPLPLISPYKPEKSLCGAGAVS